MQRRMPSLDGIWALVILMVTSFVLRGLLIIHLLLAALLIDTPSFEAFYTEGERRLAPAS